MTGRGRRGGAGNQLTWLCTDRVPCRGEVWGEAGRHTGGLRLSETRGFEFESWKKAKHFVQLPAFYR